MEPKLFGLGGLLIVLDVLTSLEIELVGKRMIG